MTKDFIDEGYPRGLAFAFVVRKIRRGGTAKSDISRMGGKAGGNADQDGHKFRSKETERGRCVGLEYNVSRRNNRSRSAGGLVGRGRGLAVAGRRRVNRRIRKHEAISQPFFRAT